MRNLMLAWVVIYRRRLRHSTPMPSSLRLCVQLSTSQGSNLPLCFLFLFTSLPPDFLTSRSPYPPAPTPQASLPTIALSPLGATLMDVPASVANKRLTARLSSLDATLTRNGGHVLQTKYFFSVLAPFACPCLPSSVRSSKFRIPQPLCLPLLRKLPGVYQQFPKRYVPALRGMEHSGSRPKGALMNPEISCSTITSTSVLPHCQQRTASGRRCRMAISDPDSGLCLKHAADRQKVLDQTDLAASLIGDIQEFRDAVTINHSLGELYKLQARNKITPRRAALHAYLPNLLLRTLPAIEHETHPPGNETQRIIIDMPRP